MGVIYGEWRFPVDEAPSLDTLIETLRRRSGLRVNCTYDDDGTLLQADLPLIRESLILLYREPSQITLHSFIPAHPYLWAQVHAAMTELGGQIDEKAQAWRPRTDNPVLERHWSELTWQQRFLLRIPTVGAWRPFDSLLDREPRV